MKKKFSIIWVLLILIFAAFVYFYKLNDIPNGFYVDEAAVAYNAYSILQTGRDIFAQPYPILFRLLGSYTPPLFIYFSVPIIYFFGMAPQVFRGISALSALVSIIFFFLLTKRLKIFKSLPVLYLATFFYAISPWLIFNARLGYETTLAYLLFNVGVYFLFSALTSPKDFLRGSIFLSLATYTAHTQRYLVPIFLSFYLLVFRKFIFRKENIKYLKLSFLVILLTQIPNILVLSTPAFWVKNERLMGQPLGQILMDIINQAFIYLSPRNLFYELNDIDMQHTVPGISVIYNWMVIPYLIGVYLFFKNIKKVGFKFIALLFSVSLVPAVFSGQFISIQRALPLLLPLSVVIGLGIDYIWQKLRSKYAIPIFILLSFYSLILLYRSYFVLFLKERAIAWNYGYSQLTDFIKQNPGSNFVIDNSRNPRNYILLLYYLKYPPAMYQNEVSSIYKIDYYRSLPSEDSYKFSNVEVRAIDWKTDPCRQQLLIGDEISISEGQAKEHELIKVYELKDYQGRIIFQGFKTNPEKKCAKNIMI